MGNYDELLKDLKPADSQNDYHFELIGEVARKTHLSRLVLFTRLLLNNKISRNNYNKVKKALEEQYKARKEEEKRT